MFGSDFGNPWEMGTGFGAPLTPDGQSFMPVAPQPDMVNQFAGALASKGIRPDQFFQNPQIARDVVSPPAADYNPWDATPVDMPGGNVVSPVGPQSGPMGAPVLPTASGTDANATGTPADTKAGKEKTFGEKLQDTLKGVKMPVPPKPQDVKTPAAPQPHGQIKTGDLIAMLMNMQPPGASAGMKLPSTLGASLMGR